MPRHERTIALSMAGTGSWPLSVGTSSLTPFRALACAPLMHLVASQMQRQGQCKPKAESLLYAEVQPVLALALKLVQRYKIFLTYAIVSPNNRTFERIIFQYALEKTIVHQCISASFRKFNCASVHHFENSIVHPQ